MGSRPLVSRLDNRPLLIRQRFGLRVFWRHRGFAEAVLVPNLSVGSVDHQLTLILLREVSSYLQV
jgi:hypothetical protein